MILMQISLAIGVYQPAHAGDAAVLPVADPARYTSPLPLSEGAIVDAIAAQFFENELQSVQAYRIEAMTAQRYRKMTFSARQQFRADRRQQWNAMSIQQRNRLRQTPSPRFLNLTETQKSVFRQIAVRRVSGTDNINAPDI